MPAIWKPLVLHATGAVIGRACVEGPLIVGQLDVERRPLAGSILAGVTMMVDAGEQVLLLTDVGDISLAICSAAPGVH